MAPWSQGTCVGAVDVAGMGTWQVVRNPGGGTSACCSMFPIAAAARVERELNKVEVELLPRKPGFASRNGARVYFAEDCMEDAFHPQMYAAWQLIGVFHGMSVRSAVCGRDRRQHPSNQHSKGIQLCRQSDASFSQRRVPRA